MTTGAAVIHVVGKSSITFKGTLIVEQVGNGLSAHLACNDGGVLRSLAYRKPSKHEVCSSFTPHREFLAVFWFIQSHLLELGEKAMDGSSLRAA